VAVHGVGDQYSYATIQSVVNQFCHFHGQPAAVPLGRFHTGQAPFSICPPFPPGTFDHLAFAEVYWARIPRQVVDDKHTMEEAKKWAATLVERLRLSWKQAGNGAGAKNADFDRVKLVLEEMIETLAVVERLCFLADKAGLFRFDLKQLLEDYLGDVQIVAEFASERRKILDTFAQTMDQVSRVNPEADLFVIAHSEGTVISLLGLLEAGCQPDPPKWFRRVRGFMTLGSPIDKHLMLWPGLFPAARPTEPGQERRIQWRNYYDKGDPIGFELDGTRRWLEANGWDQVFSFTEADDFGFVRYPFPGKAHVDYWNDREVFGHFIETVVEDPVKSAPPRRERKGPQSLQLKKWSSYVLPYLGLTALLMIGVFMLYKTVTGAIDQAASDNWTAILHLVPGITIMVLGVTVASRIPRLTRDWRWRVAAVGLGLGLALLALKISAGGASAGPRFLDDFSDSQYLYGAMGVVIVVSLVSAIWPASGTVPLILIGSAVVATMVVYGLLRESPTEKGAVWPVFLATAAFLYLWWLAALLFDLVFVWHNQIRTAKAVKALALLAGKPHSA
jgi:hypothetical protein